MMHRRTKQLNATEAEYLRLNGESVAKLLSEAINTCYRPKVCEFSLSGL